MKYKACIFDFDLTLADSSIGILICFKHTLGEFGYKIPTDEEIVRTIGLPLVDGFDVLTGIPNNPKREQMRVCYVKKADDEMVKNTFLYKDTASVLNELKSNGVKIAVVSSKMRYRVEQSFVHLMGESPADVIVGLEDVKNPKPSAEGLELAIKTLCVNKSDVLYVGDSYIDAQTAENAGVDFIGVTTGTTSKQDFSAYKNVAVCASLSELLAIIK